MSLANPGLRGFTIIKDDFELKELPQILHVVEVDASSTNDKQSAMFPNAARLAIGKR